MRLGALRGVGLLLLGCGVAAAMSITTSVSVRAFSRDGASALIEDRRYGPEGGGSLSYALVSADPPHATRFALSHDFSPGGPSRPQRVSLKDCQEQALALKKLLADKGFEGVDVRPESCEKNRAGVVTASPRRIPAAPLATDGKRLTYRSPLGSVDLGEGSTDDSLAHVAGAGKLLVVITGARGDSHLGGVWRAKAAGGFEPVGISF